MHYIYITTNNVNGKKYIGQRKKPHNKTPENDAYIGSGTLLLKAIKKYGKDNFTKEIISIHNTQKDTCDKEIELIKEYNAVDSDYFYNISDGGQMNRLDNHSESVSKSMKEYYSDDYNYLNFTTKTNRKRYLNGKKPIPYTIAEKDIINIKNETISNIRNRSKLQKLDIDELIKQTITNSVEYKDRLKRNRIKGGVLSWESNREDRIESMRETWTSKKQEGYDLNRNHKRKLSISKLSNNGNYVGVYLIENGMDNIKAIRSCLSPLIKKDYKEYANYVKQLKKVFKMINKDTYVIDYSTYIKLINDSRVFARVNTFS